MSPQLPDPKRPMLRRFPDAHVGLQGQPMWQAFLPTKSDNDGLSIHCGVTHIPREVAVDFRSNKSGGNMWVAAVWSESIQSVGLTIQANPLEQTEVLPAQPGHCLIPQMTRMWYEQDKRRAVPVMQALASAAVATHGPFSAHD